MRLPHIHVPDLGVIVFFGDLLDSGHLPAIGRSCYRTGNQNNVLLADAIRKAKVLSIVPLEINLGDGFTQLNCLSEILVALEDLRTDAFLDKFEEITVFETGPGIRGIQ